MSHVQLTDREQLGPPIIDPRSDIVEVISGLMNYSASSVKELLVADPLYGEVLLIIRDAVKARVAYRALATLIESIESNGLHKKVSTRALK